LAHAASLTTSGRGYCSHGWSNFVHGFGYEPRLPVDLMVTGSGLKSREGIRIHRSRVLTPADYGHHKSGIAVTSPARAILDSGDYLTVTQLEALIADALRARAVTHQDLEAILGRAGRRAAAKRPAAALAYIAGKGWGILPVTWQHLTEQPIMTAARIASALAVADYLRSSRM
jgi:hypothetical protein